MIQPHEGQFVWADLLTTDLEASVRFYSHLFHEWKYNLVGTDECDYRMIHAGGCDIGGILSLEQEGKSAWVAYLAAENCEDTVEKVLAHGGKRLDNQSACSDFPTLLDPCGGMFKLYPASQVSSRSHEPKLGQLCWFELSSDSPASVRQFYTAVFPWKIISEHPGEEEIYYNIHCQGQEIGGIRSAHSEDLMRQQWLPFFLVDDLEDRCELAGKLGANLVLPPSPIPGVGGFAVLIDPQGAHFALFAPIDEAA